VFICAQSRSRKGEEMKLRIEACVISDIGKVRQSNQDNFVFSESIHELSINKSRFDEYIVDEKTSLFTTGVFDGMGGESHGDIASHIAATKYREFEFKKLRKLVEPLEIVEELQEYYKKANQAICNECRTKKSRMGTTASILVLTESDAIISNIGDSRIYRLREEKLSLLTKDHTENMILVANNIKTLNKKGRLTQYLGIFEDEYIIEPYINVLHINDADVFLICSDGVTDMLSDEEIELFINTGTNIRETTEQIVESALEKGGVDNITAILCSVSYQ
jgi:PPM family protein phosphatase